MEMVIPAPLGEILSGQHTEQVQQIFICSQPRKQQEQQPGAAMHQDFLGCLVGMRAARRLERDVGLG